ncbi:Cys/Met metabolism PLP-dependent enzyme-domain-containing protein [Mycena rebaudengoi]|nr:Cys/Met metabolism PLP-dependent enzyme-domain-containing protein [Mycena rebaudengoi]
MSAFMVLQGVETLSLRAQRHCENALAVTKFLEAHPRFITISYLGQPTHSSHELALKIRILSVKKIINNLKLASHLANLGDAKTLVFAPFITIQAQITPEERLLT